MSAERNALDAALSYSQKLEEQIAAMADEIREQRMRNDELRRKVDGVKDAVRDRDHPNGPDECRATMQASTPMQDCRRCKFCGAPV